MIHISNLLYMSDIIIIITPSSDIRLLNFYASTNSLNFFISVRPGNYYHLNVKIVKIVENYLKMRYVEAYFGRGCYSLIFNR